MSYAWVRVRSRSLPRGPEVRSGRRADDPLRILLEHQPVRHELPRGRADRVDVLLTRAVPLLERGPRVVRGAALGLRLRERHVAAIEIAALALHEALRAQVPAGVGADRRLQVRGAHARHVVAVGVDLRHEHAVVLAGHVAPRKLAAVDYPEVGDASA